jgi:hypothetical protein
LHLGQIQQRRTFRAAKGFELSSHSVWPSKRIEKRLLNLLNINIITRWRHLIQQGQYPKLWEAVQATHLFKATDPRDKIYAFCNIATYPTNANLNPDYTLSVEDVYTRFTKHYLRTQFQSVIVAARNYQPRGLHDLPSWVPDFTSNDNYQLLALSGCLNLNDNYTASGEHGHAIDLDFSSTKIQLRGAYVDEIAHLASHAIDPSWNEASNSILSPALHAWHENAVSLAVAYIPPSYRCYNESRRQAFIRTLIGDRQRDGTEAQVIYKKYYKNWCQSLKISAETGAALNLLASSNSQEMTHAGIFSTAVLQAGNFRKFAITKRGYMALVSKEAEVGDIVCIILGWRCQPC